MEERYINHLFYYYYYIVPKTKGLEESLSKGKHTCHFKVGSLVFIISWIL